MMKNWSLDDVLGVLEQARDPEFKRAATDGRVDVAGYSACGDLAHLLLEYVQEGGSKVFPTNFGAHWRAGKNINMLVPWPIGSAPSSLAHQVDQLGDEELAQFSQNGSASIWVCWSRPDTSDAHVIITASPGVGKLRGYEWGATGAPNRTRYSETVTVRPADAGGGVSIITGGSPKRAQYVIDLREVWAASHNRRVPEKKNDTWPFWLVGGSAAALLAAIALRKR